MVEQVKENNYLLSVIIPVYNAEKYVRRAIRSVIEQPNFEKMEIVLVNDGSKDNSAKICDEYAKSYDNIVVVHKENGGVSSARNAALEQVKGKYCAFLDSDDWYEDNFFTDDIIASIKDGEVDIFGFSYRLISFNYKYYVKEDRAEEKEMINPLGNQYDWRMFWCYIYRTSLIKENNIWFHPVKFNEDFSFAERCFYVAKQVRYIDKFLYAYWMNPESVSHVNRTLFQYGEYCKSLRYQKEWFEGRDYEIPVERLYIWYIDRMLPNFCSELSFEELNKLFIEDPRFYVIDKSEELAGKPVPNVEQWKNDSKLFWKINNNKKVKLKTFLYRHAWIHAFVDAISSIRNKRAKVDKNTIKKIKQLSK